MRGCILIDPAFRTILTCGGSRRGVVSLRMPSERVQRQIEALLDEADAAIRVQDWQTVRDRAEAALAFDPDNEDAKGYLGAAGRQLAVALSGTRGRRTFWVQRRMWARHEEQQ